MKVPYRIVAGVAFALLAMAGAPGAQSPPAAIEAWDRTQLAPDIEFADGNGGRQAGVLCATRPVYEAEAMLVDQLVEANRRLRGDFQPRGKINIPIVFHIVRARKGKQFNVTDQQVRQQLDVLNDAFKSKGFKFSLRQLIRYNDNKFARKCGNYPAERRFKRKHAIDPPTTLNVYSCRARQGGYARLPQSRPEDHYLHGAVVHYAFFPGGGASPYDEGDLLVHEVGHYLGLSHTFRDGCTGKGDRVADTPREARPSFRCVIGRDTCPDDLGVDPITNFMDYSPDACTERFTPGQKERMLDQVATFKPTLWAQS